MADRYFSYGERELAYLRKKDKKLAAVINQLGYVRRPVIPDLFQALVNAILGQQISSKAADTVWQRFQEVCSPVTPEHVLCFSKEDLQACGTTFRKIGYIQDISHEFVSGRLQTEIVSAMPDNLFCQTLCQLPGIGQWTAEMLLIHCLEPGAARCAELWRPCYFERTAHDIPAPEHHQRSVPPVSETVFSLWYSGQHLPLGRFRRSYSRTYRSGRNCEKGSWKNAQIIVE